MVATVVEAVDLSTRFTAPGVSSARLAASINSADLPPIPPEPACNERLAPLIAPVLPSMMAEAPTPAFNDVVPVASPTVPLTVMPLAAIRETFAPLTVPVVVRGPVVWKLTWPLAGVPVPALTEPRVTAAVEVSMTFQFDNDPVVLPLTLLAFVVIGPAKSLAFSTSVLVEIRPELWLNVPLLTVRVKLTPDDAPRATFGEVLLSVT